MKKFYKQAEAGTAPGGFVIRLDGKLLKTPLQKNLILSSRELAEAIAAEWNAQGSEIVAASMPLMQLASTMTDKAEGDERAAMNAEIVKYGSSDLVCYLASHPVDLVERQEEHWLPLVSWMKDAFGVELTTVKGIQYQNQPVESIERVRKLVNGLDAAEFTVAQAAMGVSGSAVIALAFLKRRIDAEKAYAAACIDEIYQLEKWGEDALARKRLDRIRAELKDIERFRDFVMPSS